MKIVVTDYIHDDQRFEAQALGEAGHDFSALQLKFKDEEAVFEKIRDAEAIVVNMVPMPASLIKRLDCCGLIIRHGIGYDNVDVDACTRKGIQFAYQPDYCEIEVAEHAVSLILASGRKLHASRRILDRSVQKGEWDFSDLFPLHRLEGKVLGLLGIGRIGSIVARKMSAFGMRIIACDPLQPRSHYERLGVEAVSVDELFRQSDFLSIHTPLSPETRGIVNARNIDRMKPTAWIINTARAGMIKTEDLTVALSERRIAGAALDVFDKEPPPPGHPLLTMDNVLLTPHIGWASVESGMQIRVNIVDDLISFGNGGNARHVINNVMRK